MGTALRGVSCDTLRYLKKHRCDEYSYTLWHGRGGPNVGSLSLAREGRWKGGIVSIVEYSICDKIATVLRAHAEHSLMQEHQKQKPCIFSETWRPICDKFFCARNL